MMDHPRFVRAVATLSCVWSAMLATQTQAQAPAQPASVSGDPIAAANMAVRQCAENVQKMRTQNMASFNAAAQAKDTATVSAIRLRMRQTASECLAPIDPSQVLPPHRGTLGVLQLESGQFPVGLATLRAYAGDATVPATDRATAIESAQRSVGEAGTDTTVLSVMRALIPLADSTHVARASINSRVFMAQIGRLNSATRGDSYGQIREAIQIAIADPDTSTRAKRAQSVARMIQLVRTWSERDDRQAEAQTIAELAEGTFRIYPAYFVTLDPAALIGSRAAEIEGARWLNAPQGMTRLTFGDGKVYILELTAHWCGPCRETYEPVAALQAQYAKQGLTVVYATQLYGYFGDKESVSPKEELDALTRYFKSHGVKFPIAITGDFRTGRPVPNPNFVNYGLTALPELILIDRAGVVRRVWRGWGDDVEASLAETVAQVLAEPATR